MTDKSDYPKFLITIYTVTDRLAIKESICKMIIKFFGKKKGDGDGADESSKIEFINLVEPLVQLVSRVKEIGNSQQKVCALSVMAIVNMCNFSEDIKDIFLQKNGFQIIMDLLDSKDEDIMLNCLRLIMTLINKKKGDTSQIGRTLGEEKDYAMIRRLIHLVKDETGINYTHYCKDVYYYAI